ncbi:DUF6449 domain-containing protein [Butyrivibrio sp. AE2032]|uniref:DUF6449 domain-containing protein n=1 Tax=Butyrivibrio sp. AE2032 TaxID=1458463 RepID=UPI000554863B|nr:DUF6449 domain-containing protein [Butyrivibrio sp. AE2032]
MTSANLSLGEKLKNHKTYINRTLWTSYVALPFMAAYFILGVIMMVSRATNYAEMYHQSLEVLQLEKLRAVAMITGMESFSWFFVAIIAFMFALQGFSYIFNQSQLDFYLSQPTTRAQRIRRNYFNAISTYLLLYLSCEIVALLIAAVMGAVNSYVLMSALIETVRNLLLFFTVYNITVLAVILSGTLPIAVILTGCFAFISLIIAGEISLYKGVFFATYSYMDSTRAYLSPVSDTVASYVALVSNLRANGALMSMDYINANLKSVFTYDLDCLVTGIIAFVFVIIFARNRQAEWAGKSIPLRPFRWLVKIVGCIVVGLASGYFVYIVYESVWNNSLHMMMFVIMVIGTVLAGCIIEVILEGNIRKFFKGFAQTIMALAIVILVFVICKGDLCGFDTYVPAKDKIASAALINGSRDFNVGSVLYDNFDYSEADEMVLTNIDDMLAIASKGMETKKAERQDQEQGRYVNSGYDTTVLFRLKSGRKVYRAVTIPYDVLDNELDRIVNNEEYKKGHFDVFHDEMIREVDAKSPDHNLRYNNNDQDSGLDTKHFSFAELSDAYRKDLLENYSFKYAKEHMPIGSIEYESNDDTYIYGSINVFENFTNTIALLKKYGIYSENDLDAEHISSVKVSNYYPGYDLEQVSVDDIDDAPDTVFHTYTDKEQMAQILEQCICTNYYNEWFNYNLINDQYHAEVMLDNEPSYYGGIGYSFFKGKVPEFVKTDTNN